MTAEVVSTRGDGLWRDGTREGPPSGRPLELADVVLSA
jgi:hypothetical protein